MYVDVEKNPPASLALHPPPGEPVGTTPTRPSILHGGSSLTFAYLPYLPASQPANQFLTCNLSGATAGGLLRIEGFGESGVAR